MSKVYCQNCKYINCVRTFNFSPIKKYYCKKEDYCFLGIAITCFQKNKDGNCPDYKRKWWKFWVKG